jgi:dTDP-4-amino-4,6-dideoxygalactose transaminase
VYEFLRENNIYARKYFFPLTADQACFKNKYKTIDLKVSRKLSKEVLLLPIYDVLDICGVDEISQLVKDCVL